MLGEHNITYRPRTPVKGQVITDFLAEMSDESPSALVVETQQEPWTLFMDGSSCVDGSGAAEYEALIAGLRIAAQMGVQNLHVSVDSKLVANQVLGAYVDKEENMIKYLEKHAHGTTVPGSQIHTTGILLANDAPRRTRYDTYMQRLSNTSSRDKKPPTASNPNHGSVAVLQERVSDNDKQFSDNPFKDWCDKLNITQRFASVKHPQSNGLVKRANRSLGEGIKARLGERNKNWIEELPHVFWAYRIMIKSSNGDTPLSLTYGMKAVIPAEIGMPTLSIKSQGPNVIVRPKPKGLSYPLYVIKSPQSSIFTACSVVLRAVNIARLCSFSTACLPSSVTKVSKNPFLCFVGIIWYYELDDNCYPTFLTDDDEDLLDNSTLATEIGATTAVTVPFVTSYVTPTLERESGGHTYSIIRPYLRTQHPAERFAISSDFSHHSSVNSADDEVTPIVRSFAPPPPVLTAAIATTTIAGATSAPVHEPSTRPVQRSIFRDFASPSTTEANVDVPSQPANAEVSTDTFYISQEMDSETIQQTYVPMWNVINYSRQACFSAEVRLRSEHNYSYGAKVNKIVTDQINQDEHISNNAKKAMKRRFNQMIKILETDEYGLGTMVDIWRLKVETGGGVIKRDTEIASLKAQLSLKEAEAAKANRLCSQVAAIEGTKADRVDELNGLKERKLALKEEKNGHEKKVAVLEFADAAKETELTSLTAQTDKLTQDLFELGLSCNELSVKASTFEAKRDRLVGQVSSLEGTCFGLREEVMGYKLFKEQIETDGLAADIDHGMGGRGLTNVAAYNPSTKANYIFVVNALCAMDFPLLAQLKSHKDASIADIMGLLHLEGPRTRGNAASRQLSISDALVPLFEPLSAENLVGEASTSGLPAMITTTALSTTFIQTGFIPPVSVADYEVLGAGPSIEVPSPLKIVFEKEELKTTLEHPTAD
nr:reverse transcriptase domain-containing protein [Tanacetum cinerariifolium]